MPNTDNNDYLEFLLRKIPMAKFERRPTRPRRGRRSRPATSTRPRPGGGSIDVVELTPEQAERLYGIKQAPEGDKVPPASDVKASDVKAPEGKAGDAKAD